MNTCYIFGAAEGLPESFDKDETDIVIAADAGIKHIEGLGITADIAVGDFDSLGYVPNCKEIIKHPVMKDDTDMILAVETGRERGYNRFVIYGGMGGRADHTLANYQMLCKISRTGGNCFLCGNGFTVTAVTNSQLSFSENASGTVSVFSATEKSSGVTLKGLKYELRNAELYFDYPLGVSNEFTGKKSHISVEEGTLIVVFNGNICFLNNLKGL